MEFNLTFFSGLGCGICIGLSLFALKRVFGSSPVTPAEVKKVVKKLSSKVEYKMILVVRTDLQMSKGKIAAQCSHAAVGAFEKAQKKDPESLEIWQYHGQAKVAVKTDSLEEMKQIAANAKQLGLITSMIRDAGRTQIAPNTITVLGVGPAPKDLVDKVTGHLKLL